TLAALLVGPTANESARGVTTAIPKGTSLLGLVIDKGLANVNLSSLFKGTGDTASLAVRLAQVACTLASFPSVKGLQVALDGQPENPERERRPHADGEGGGTLKAPSKDDVA